MSVSHAKRKPNNFRDKKEDLREEGKVTSKAKKESRIWENDAVKDGRRAYRRKDKEEDSQSSRTHVPPAKSKQVCMESVSLFGSILRNLFVHQQTRSRELPSDWVMLKWTAHSRIDGIVPVIASINSMMALMSINAYSLAMRSAQLRVAVQQRGFILRGSRVSCCR